VEAEGHLLSEEHLLAHLHHRADFEELVVSDEFPGGDLHDLLPGHLDVFGVESQDWVVAHCALGLQEFLELLGAAVHEVR
jgi:hypothetical protein